MRKLLVAAAATALVLAPLSAAEATSSKHYKISISLTDGTYKNVIDLSQNHSEAVKISGKVKGGAVKGKSVRITARNLNNGNRRVTVKSKAKLSRSGSYKTSWRPPEGGRWVVEVTKKKSGKYATKTAKKNLDAFLFVDAAYFSPVANDPSLAAESGDTKETVRGSSNGYGDRRYAIAGGGSLTFNTAGYRCKKFAFHIGISDSSVTTSGTYRVTQAGQQVAGMATSNAAGDVQVKVDPFNPNVPVTISVDPVPTGQRIRFLIGNPKVFCTYPLHG